MTGAGRAAPLGGGGRSPEPCPGLCRLSLRLTGPEAAAMTKALQGPLATQPDPNPFWSEFGRIADPSELPQTGEQRSEYFWHICMGMMGSLAAPPSAACPTCRIWLTTWMRPLRTWTPGRGGPRTSGMMRTRTFFRQRFPAVSFPRRSFGSRRRWGASHAT
jgi:hypothetical protein